MNPFRYVRTFLTIQLLFSSAFAQEKAHLALDSPFASFVEDDAPFFTQTVDARSFGETPEPKNLTPRGIIVKAGHDFFGCFDPDLLRWALFWKANDDGEYLTMDGMGTGSYRLPNRKASAGQKELPKPIGVPLVATPPLPGWLLGDGAKVSDPRDRGNAEADEIGLGPIPADQGRFSGLRLSGKGVQIEYSVGGTTIREQLSAEKKRIFRDIEVAAHENPLKLHTGEQWLTLEPAASHRSFRLVIAASGMVRFEDDPDFPAAEAAPRRWNESVTTRPATQAPTAAAPTAALIYDDLTLPVPNPWNRNVRLSGFDFFPDGRAALCTFDGDIWVVTGLAGVEGKTTWTRFASGLHEPQSLSLIDGIVQVFDRNGIVRLHDTDKNGEADWYENFSNIVAQTAETREFPMDMVAATDGSFYLAKGGQIGSTIGKLNGTIVKVSPDGRDYEVISTGLRQPYLGYDPETGILTSSDQQGNWKPATPIYRIEPGRYFGFLPEKFKDKVPHPAPINDPEVWIPHFIDQSGAGQVWLKGPGGAPAKMGGLNGSLIHIGYNRPEIFKVYLDEKGGQGAILPLLSGFPSGILKGRVNPVDGLLYVTGFEIWGTSGSRISGLFRVKPGSAKSWVPREIKAERRGVLLAFDEELSPELAADISRYAVDRWNYRQTHEYGSGNFKLDGEPGQESVPVSSAKLSADKKSLFIGLPGMAPSHTLRVTYRIPAPDSVQVESAYLTVRALAKMELTSLGFDTDDVDLTKKAGIAENAVPVEPTADLGREVAIRYGCVACHATGDSALPAPPVATTNGAQVAVGPPWVGLAGAKRTFTDGSEIAGADDAYLKESILDPARRVAADYEMEKTGVGMPSYLGVLKDHEIESIVLYINTLKKK